MRKNHNPVPSRLIFFRSKGPPQKRFDPQHGKEMIGRYPVRIGMVRLSIAGQIETPRSKQDR